MGSLLQDVLGLFQKKKYKEPLPYVPSKDDYFVLSTKADSSLNVMAYLPKVEQTLISAKQFADAISAGSNTTYDLTVVDDGSIADIVLTGSDGSLDKVKIKPGTNVTVSHDVIAGSITISSTDQFVGTVTSVDATTNATGVLNAIDVSGGPITTSGTLTFNFTGTIAQYVDGSGHLQNFPTIPTGMMYQFDISADTGTPETIKDSDNLIFGGGQKIITEIQAPDTVKITHDNTTRTDTTSSQSPAFGDVITVIDSITQDSSGHPTAVNLKSITLPTPATDVNTTYDLTGQVSNVDDYAILLDGSDGSLDKVTLEAGNNVTLTDQGTNTVKIDVTIPPSGGVTSLENLTGALNLVAGANITIFDNGSDTITISASGGSGSVTSVGLSAPSAFTVTGSPVSTSGTLAFTGAGTAQQYIDGTGSLQTFPTVGSGTVTSVAATINGDAISISGSPITTSGTLAFNFGGNSTEYINGDGDLVTFPSFQAPLTLTTTGTSGAATLVGNTLNIPEYSTATGSDEKFKVDSSDTVAGYWTDKITIGSGLSQTISTEPNGEKLIQIHAVSYNMVNSIKVGSQTQSGMFEFVGPGVTMDSTVNPIEIEFAGVLTLAATTAGDALDVAVTNNSTTTGISTAAFTWAGSGSQYIDGQGNLQTFPSIPSAFTFNVEGDSGSPYTVPSGGTVDVAGGTGISTTNASGVITVDLDNTGVTAGSYTNANIEVNAQGQITLASNGTATSYQAGKGIVIDTTTNPDTIEVDYGDPTNNVIQSAPLMSNAAEPDLDEDHLIYQDVKTFDVYKIVIGDIFDKWKSQNAIAEQYFSVNQTGLINNGRGTRTSLGSVTTGIGAYTISWTNAFPNTDYLVNLTTETAAGQYLTFVREKSTTGFIITVTDLSGTPIDTLVNVVLYE
jgi:hypothetical protein